MSHQSDLPPHVPSCVSTGAGVEVPDATATPRTIEQAAQECLTNLECNNYGFAEACAIIASAMREVVERELTAAKAEIARVTADFDRVTSTLYDRVNDVIALKDRAERAEAELRERTQWQCKCGGTDCAGQAENERLWAEVNELQLFIARMQAEGGICRVYRGTDAELNLIAERDQLRARVAGLQRLLGEVYRNTNLRHHPELTGLADIVSKQLST